MKRFQSVKSVAGTVLFTLLLAVPASAQATRTWVSGVGDDVNPCSRTAPCKTFAGAYPKTAAGGEIDVLDPGGFGSISINKALTIAAEGAGEGGILVAGTNAITVSAGASDVVILRGLQLDGGPASSNSLSGVKFNSGRALEIQNCSIRNFTGSPGYGIFFAPSGTSSLFVSDTVVTSNGSAAGGGGIFVQPTAGGSASVSLVRVNVVNNLFGVRADGTGSTGIISVTFTDSAATENTNSGLTAFSPPGGAITRMTVIRSVSANNGTGVYANGVATSFRMGYSNVSGNNTGVNIMNGAAMSSMGNNLMADNTNAGSAVPIVGPM